MTILFSESPSISKEYKRTTCDLLLLINFRASAKDDRLLRTMKYAPSDRRLEDIADCCCESSSSDSSSDIIDSAVGESPPSCDAE